MLKKAQGFLYRHIQYIKDTLFLIFYIQSFPVIALSLTDLTGHIYIGQEMHLDLDNAVS